MKVKVRELVFTALSAILSLSILALFFFPFFKEGNEDITGFDLLFNLGVKTNIYEKIAIIISFLLFLMYFLFKIYSFVCLLQIKNGKERPAYSKIRLLKTCRNRGNQSLITFIRFFLGYLPAVLILAPIFFESGSNKDLILNYPPILIAVLFLIALLIDSIYFHDFNFRLIIDDK